jgi:hypothetical protein
MRRADAQRVPWTVANLVHRRRDVAAELSRNDSCRNVLLPRIHLQIFRGASVPQITTAGALLVSLQRESQHTREAVVSAAAIDAERADATMQARAPLTLAEQMRLAEATLVVAPQFARAARRLKAQVLAARSFEAGEVETHAYAPVERWERIAPLRR